MTARAGEARFLGVAVALAAVVAALLLTGLDLLVGVPDGKGRTISAYVYSDAAWVFHTAVWLLVAATITFVVALVRTGLRRPLSPAVVLFALAAVGLVLVAVFPKTDWSVGDSPTGRLHRLGGMLAFLLPPFATLRLTRGAREVSARLARGVAALVLLVLAGVTVLAFGMAAQGGAWYHAFPLGQVERIVVGALLLALGLLGRWVAGQPAPESSSRAISEAEAARADA